MTESVSRCCRRRVRACRSLARTRNIGSPTGNDRCAPSLSRSIWSIEGASHPVISPSSSHATLYSLVRCSNSATMRFPTSPSGNSRPYRGSCGGTVRNSSGMGCASVSSGESDARRREFVAEVRGVVEVLEDEHVLVERHTGGQHTREDQYPRAVGCGLHVEVEPAVNDLL